MNTTSKNALRALTGFAVLGGALLSLSLLPAFSQDAPPAPPANSPQDAPPPADGPLDGASRPDGPRQRGPRDARRASRPGDMPRPGGPRGDHLRPLEGPFQVDRSGRLVGPREERGPTDGREPRGPADGPRDGRGPKGKKDKGHKRDPKDHKGPRDGRGPQDGPPPPPRDGGPDGRGPDGPKGGSAGAMERAYRGAGELDRYGQLSGDVLNLTGQARSYYTRADAALQAGNEAQALPLARISERLTQAALHLERAQNGPLPLPSVAGWTAPAAPSPKAPANGEAPRELSDLNARLQSPHFDDESAQTTWTQTARRLAVQARLDLGAKNLEASREHARAALTLLDAAQEQARTS